MHFGGKNNFLSKNVNLLLFLFFTNAKEYHFTKLLARQKDLDTGC
jgi:hypothetical protein